MFWTDPNLYNVAFRDLPYRDLPYRDFPTIPPVYGAIPRYFQGFAPPVGYNPYPMNPAYFTPQYNVPQFNFPQFNVPQYNVPQFNTPYLPKEMMGPFVNPPVTPMTHPFHAGNWGLPFYNTFRPYGI